MDYVKPEINSSYTVSALYANGSGFSSAPGFRDDTSQFDCQSGGTFDNNVPCP